MSHEDEGLRALGFRIAWRYQGTKCSTLYPLSVRSLLQRTLQLFLKSVIIHVMAAEVVVTRKDIDDVLNVLDAMMTRIDERFTHIESTLSDTLKKIQNIVNQPAR